MTAIAGALGPVAGLIVENGGAVVVPEASPLTPPVGACRDGEEWVFALGIGREHLAKALAEIAQEIGVPVRGFSTLTVGEIAALTGLPPEAARRASAREYDEPFLLGDDVMAPRVAAAAESRKLRLTHGGRFYHLTGNTDKGGALHTLLSAQEQGSKRFFTVGLGDAANDRSLLEAVDRAIVVPSPEGSADPALASVPGASFATAPGPRGWNAAVLTILDERRAVDGLKHDEQR
jgi:mannosyl-3-phosphoglycerate phosphatase